MHNAPIEIGLAVERSEQGLMAGDCKRGSMQKD